MQKELKKFFEDSGLMDVVAPERKPRKTEVERLDETEPFARSVELRHHISGSCSGRSSIVKEILVSRTMLARWQNYRPGRLLWSGREETGAWTRIKIVVAGSKARLYVNGADQPCLIVNDLKLGETHGQVALWTGSNSEAYFSNLTIR